MHKLLNKYWWLGPTIAAIAYFGVFGYAVHKQQVRIDIDHAKAKCWDNRSNPDYVCNEKSINPYEP
jgi:hypothetical protein